MYRVYYTWENRKSPTKCEYPTQEQAELGVSEKFKSKKCFSAKLENLENGEIKTFYNEI